MRTRLMLLVTLAAAILALDFGSAAAQRRQPSTVRMTQSQHTAEINVFGGYSFTFSRRYCNIGCGNIDLKDSGMWGIELDVNVQPYTQLALLYNRQDTQLTWQPDFGSKQTLGDVAVEYWHIGGVKGVPQGKVMPFGSFTLGATRFNFKNSNLSDEWRFSLMLGLGAKIYASERIGLRLQGRFPFTFISSGYGWGYGGAYIGGTGVGQIDFSAGLMLLL